MTGSFLQERALKIFAWVGVVLLALGYMLSSLVYQTPVHAAEVTDRSLAIGTSEEDVETTYTVEFDMPASTTAGAFRVEFCDSDPLANLTCTFDGVGDDVPQVDGNAGSAVTLNTGSSSVTNATGGNCDTLSLSAITPGDHFLTVTCGGADTLGGSASTVTLVFDDVDNPDNSTDGTTNNSFYARIYVYDTTSPPAAANPMSTTNQVHTGGVVASTAEQLTITARVQEILEFCVGTDTQPGVDECADMTGNSVDLGVLDFASVNQSTTETPASQGSIMVRTNASIGVVVDYFAEQDGTGTNHEGALRVAGATCDATVPSTDETDQCINSVGTTQSVISAGDEEFGFCVFNIDQTNGSADGGTVTSNLTADAEYDGTATGCLADGVAFDESGSTDTIATSIGSGGVLNDEMLELDFLATADLTTPSGLYSVILTFIGTATY